MPQTLHTKKGPDKLHHLSILPLADQDSLERKKTQPSKEITVHSQFLSLKLNAIMPKASYNKSVLGIGMPCSQVNFE